MVVKKLKYCSLQYSKYYAIFNLSSLNFDHKRKKIMLFICHLNVSGSHVLKRHYLVQVMYKQCYFYCSMKFVSSCIYGVTPPVFYDNASPRAQVTQNNTLISDLNYNASRIWRHLYMTLHIHSMPNMWWKMSNTHLVAVLARGKALRKLQWTFWDEY